MSGPKFVAVIPARMGSSRFPGKPLARLLNRPMIEHVYRRTALCRRLAAVYVATCDLEIADAVKGFGGEAVMTAAIHERASDRVAEVASRIDADVVVMVQGDEPTITPEMIEQAITPFLSRSEVQCVNLVAPIKSVEEFADPNTIKVVMNRNREALYFSREPIPTQRGLGQARIPLFKQVCVIPFRRQTLMEYAALEPTPLEQVESIDMLRFLEHGYKVHLVETAGASHAVDTPTDLELVESLLRQDPLVQRYI